MTQTIVVCDFETVSRVDLVKAGAHRYAEDVSTRVLCFCYQIKGHDNVDTWIPTTESDDLMTLAADPQVVFVAHNAAFEKAIWKHVMKGQHGYPPIDNTRWRDTTAWCARRRLPLRLEDVAKTLGLPQAKDTQGGVLVRKLNKHYAKTGSIECDAATLGRIVSYCIQDVRTTMALFDATRFNADAEHDVWLLDQTINERGVQLDRDFVAAAQDVLDLALPALEAEFYQLVGCSHNQRQKVLDWLRWEQGVDIANMKKATVDALMGQEEDDEDNLGDEPAKDHVVYLTDDARRALGLRQLMRSSSVKKLQRMDQCVSRDGRARGLLQYHGAGTGRWAGRLFQPQNFPRGTVKARPDLAVEAIHLASKIGDANYVELALGVPPLETVASALRHCIVPSPGHTLVAGDFAQIEARIVLALADEDCDALKSFETGTPYEDMASLIYGRPITKADVEERQIGKNTVLGCGFGMGAFKFWKRYCEHQGYPFAKEVILKYRGISSWENGVRTITTPGWADQVPILWHELMNHASYQFYGNEVVRGKIPDGIEFEREGNYLTIRLPSGRKLWYPGVHTMEPEPVYEMTDKGRVLITDKYGEPVMARFQWGYWDPRGREVKAYGGLLTENIVQAIARDIMVNAMKKCEAEGMPVVLTVHDEIVCETMRPDAARALKQVMVEELPSWVTNLGIPVAAETWAGDRYKK